MTFDLTAYDLGKWDQILITSETGLKLMQCANWTESASHGGIRGTAEVSILFDDFTDAENLSGATDYRKCFIYASEDDVLNKTYSIELTAPTALSDRLTATIAAGTSSDDMTDKPDNSAFASSLSCSINAGMAQPIWIKRTLTAPSSENPAYFRKVGIKIIMT